MDCLDKLRLENNINLQSKYSLRGSYHFYDKFLALLGQLLCIMPKVGKKNLLFFLLAINEILNEIAASFILFFSKY
jgi:hypothetical protein